MIFRVIIGSVVMVAPLWAYDLKPIESRLGKIQTELSAFSKSIRERALSGRLAQARLRFSWHAYSDALVILGPFLNSGNPEVLKLAGHCEFELGNYLAAASHFKTLGDPLSLHRKVQIAERLNDFDALEKAYRQIISPPDFVRYIYARQLVLKGQDLKALPELEKLAHSLEYKERAVYIKAVVWVRQNNPDKAQELLTTLSRSQNLELAQLARLAKARLSTGQEQPEKAEDLKQLNLMKEKILADDPELFKDPWVLEQPEMLQLEAMRQKIDRLESLWNETDLAYKIFKIEFIGRFQARNSRVVQIAHELVDIQERLVFSGGAELALTVSGPLNSAMFELDGRIFSVQYPQKLEPGKHELIVTSLGIRQVYSFKASSGELVKIALTLGQNQKILSKQTVIGTNLPLLSRLSEQASSLTHELRRIQMEEPQKMLAEVSEAQADLKGLGTELNRLKERYEITAREVFSEAKPIWLAQLDEKIRGAEQAMIQIRLGELMRLKKHIEQIEQVKAEACSR